MNATPRFLVVARRVGERSSMAGVLHEVDSHRDALRSELRSTDSSLAREYEEHPNSFETFEVYAVGRGNENSPRVFTPSEANRWWFSSD